MKLLCPTVKPSNDAESMGRQTYLVVLTPLALQSNAVAPLPGQPQSLTIEQGDDKEEVKTQLQRVLGREDWEVAFVFGRDVCPEASQQHNTTPGSMHCDCALSALLALAMQNQGDTVSAAKLVNNVLDWLKLEAPTSADCSVGELLGPRHDDKRNRNLYEFKFVRHRETSGDVFTTPWQQVAQADACHTEHEQDHQPSSGKRAPRASVLMVATERLGPWYLGLNHPDGHPICYNADSALLELMGLSPTMVCRGTTSRCIAGSVFATSHLRAHVAVLQCMYVGEGEVRHGCGYQHGLEDKTGPLGWVIHRRAG